MVVILLSAHSHDAKAGQGLATPRHNTFGDTIKWVFMVVILWSAHSHDAKEGQGLASLGHHFR